MEEDLNKTNIENQIPDSQPQTKASLLKALQSDFSTAVNKVYVNSLKREVCFSEIKVKEQKSLTRITAANENRKDMIYDAYCALINKACLESDFDIYKLLEFDRIKLMLALYQSNMFANDIKFTCEECGAENVYKLDFDNTIKRFDDFDIEPKKFNFKNKNFNYDFIISFPKVSRVSKFFEFRNSRQLRKLAKKELIVDENMQNIEYVNLFIRELKFKNLNTKKETIINFDNYLVSDIDEIINTFPQDVLYSETGVIKYIVKEFLETLNSQFDKHACANCGTIHEKGGENNVENFF